MTVKQLIVALQEEKPDAEVFLSSDAEGNRFSSIDELAEVADDDGDEMLLVIFPK